MEAWKEEESLAVYTLVDDKGQQRCACAFCGARTFLVAGAVLSLAMANLALGIPKRVATAWLPVQEGSVLVAPHPKCASGYPPDFIWGVGPAAYQIEGAVNETGRTPSIWDVFSHQPARITNGDTGDVADDHVHRWRDDIALMVSMGVRHYRLSISWSRAMRYDESEARMVPNEPGLSFYNALLEGLRSAGITPHLTLYHWDLPLAMHVHKGGWHTPNNHMLIEEFVSYATLCFERFGHLVATWWTFNEPWTFAVAGYSQGNHAPGCAPSVAEPGPTGCPNGDTIPYIVAHNVLNAHAAAVGAYRRRLSTDGQAAPISITLNCEGSLPLDPSSPDDVAASERAYEFWLGWFLQPILTGEYPAVMRDTLGGRLPSFTPAERAALIGSIDVLSLNHYSTRLVRSDSPGETWCGWAADQRLSATYSTAWRRSGSWWERDYAPGFRDTLRWASKRWDGPVYVTENGWSCNTASPAAAANDEEQVSYFKAYTSQLADAMNIDGIDVRAYFAWSLYDNFEWADGFSKRFGLVFVDYQTQRRYPKAAARWWNTTRRACYAS
jgi:beta-glucosidase